MKPLLVGELNPYGDDDYFALYPRPLYASGHRLCEMVMGLKEADYLERFDRINLCYRRFSIPVARQNAAGIFKARPGGTIVLFGQKAATAFGLESNPFTHLRLRSVESADGRLVVAPAEAGDASARTVVQIPHPSGLNRVWNAPGAFGRAREVLKSAGVL